MVKEGVKSKRSVAESKSSKGEADKFTWEGEEEKW